jgi:hypothetical protein
VKPLVPLAEIDQFVRDPVRAVLVEDLVNSSGQPLGISVRKGLLVVEEYPCVVVFPVQRFEVAGVVRHENDTVVRTPLQQRVVSRVFAEPIFRLLNLVPAFPEQSLEDATDVFVEKDSSGRQ